MVLFSLFRVYIGSLVSLFGMCIDSMVILCLGYVLKVLIFWFECVLKVSFFFRTCIERNKCWWEAKLPVGFSLLHDKICSGIFFGHLATEDERFGSKSCCH